MRGTARRFIIVFAMATMLASVATGAAVAARRAAGPNGAKITFDPPTVVVGTQYRINGSGFRANTWVSVGAYYSDTTWWASGVTDDQGNISLSLVATRPGEILHEAYQQGRSGRFRLKTTATLSVNPAPD